MNLEVFYELRDRLEDSAIAGINLLSEDFRLKRAVEKTEAYAKTAAVFKQIYEMGLKLLDDKTEDKAAVLLDELALLDAVLCTQASLFTDEEFTEIKNLKPVKEVYTELPYSSLKPLLEALRGTGSGRYALIRDAHERNPEIFKDYRLRFALVAALGDSYSEISSMAASWLKDGNENTVSLLKEGFDFDGKGEMALRLEIIDALSKNKENDFYKECIEKGTKEIKIAAIKALRHTKENFELILGLTKTEKGKIKEAAVSSLSFMGEENCKDHMRELVLKSPISLVPLLKFTKENWISDILAEVLKRYIDKYNSLSADNKEDKKKVKADIDFIMDACVGKSSENMLKSLEEAYNISGDTLATVLADSLIDNPTYSLCDFIKNLYDEKGDKFLHAAFMASMLTESKESVYEKYSPYLKKGILDKVLPGSKKGNELIGVFFRLSYSKEKDIYLMSSLNTYLYNYKLKIENGFDERWYELILDYAGGKNIKEENMYTYDDVLIKLYKPDIKGLDKLYREHFNKQIRKRFPRERDIEILKLCKEENFEGIISNMAKLKGYNERAYHYIGDIINVLPISAMKLAAELDFLINNTDKKRAYLVQRLTELKIEAEQREV